MSAPQLESNRIVRWARDRLSASGRAELSTISQLREEGRVLRETRRALEARMAAETASLGRHERFNNVASLVLAGHLWRHYALCRELFGPPEIGPPPPRAIPPELRAGFSMEGRVAIEDSWADATYPQNWPLIYTDTEVGVYLERLARKQYFIYGMTDVWLWQAFERFPVRGLEVVNMGSLTPWYESTCLHFGARPTTIDYNKILSQSDRLNTMTVAEWDAERPRFDAAISISSFEHDGLGMYGDPLDPDGDLSAMRKMKEIVKPGGLLYFAVPVGRDKVMFNTARVYGALRLPRMLDGWKEVGRFGLEPSHMDGPGHIQPILVLENI